MKITYDGDMYHITTEYPETEFHVSTDNIAEAKKWYMEHLMRVFDDTVRSKFWEEKLHLF
jgi:hypothetical protein